MAFAVTVASAQNFTSATGGITSANDWSTSGEWVAGAYTDTSAAATHALKTGASGAFDYKVKFKVGDVGNTIKIGLKAKNGNEYAIQLNGKTATFNGASLGTLSGAITDDYWAQIYSEDGNVWYAKVSGNTASATVGSVPASATLALTCIDPIKVSPIIYNVDFVSAESAATPTPDPEDPSPTPTASPTPDPEDPTPVPVPSAPVIDLEKVQDYYNNAYTKMYSPYDTVTYNPDGTYTVTPGYPKADGTAAPAAASYAVSGTVTAKADGKPISGAGVVLGSAFQKTDDFGKFRFDGVSKGSADLAVSADGFASTTQIVDVKDNLQLSIALDKASAEGSGVASAANETGNKTTTTTTNTTTTNTTAPVTTPVNNTTAPAPTQTKSPGFGIVLAALAFVAVAGLLYVNRKK